MRSPSRWALAGAPLSALAALVLWPGLAWASPEGRISQVEAGRGTVEFILSAEGLVEGQSIDPTSVLATVAGQPAETRATPVDGSGSAPERTVLLVLDTSGSMAQGDRLVTAREAARAYLAGLPVDVRVGLITFADEARVVREPTEDHAEVDKALLGLRASGSTALNDAVALAVRTLGEEGSRNAVLLSDGEDEGSTTSASAARAGLRDSGVVLDAVSLGSGGQQAELTAFAEAGGGALVTATSADALTAAFESAARAVSGQLAVTVTVPAGVPSGTAELAVTARAGDWPISDTAIALVPRAVDPQPSGDPYGPISVGGDSAGVLGASWLLPAAVAALFLALATITIVAMGAVDPRHRTQGRVARRLEDVSVLGAPSVPDSAPKQGTVLGESTAVRRAVSFAERVAASRDSTVLVRKLEEANVSLRAGEWVVVHGLVAVLTALLATLLGGFNFGVSLLAFLVGLLGPWLYLGNRAEKRRAAFYSALPDSMQMLAGSLSAGYSLPQALDNVAKEAGGPLGQEVNRALLESRLGLPVEETLEAAAQRMHSRDFHWVVMAIRINRKVGGNLAEVLTNVGKTLRERERLRRQVKTLSAEGVLSAWILGSLPFLLLGYMLAFRRVYIVPMLTDPIGWAMFAVGGALYVTGILWMRNLVRMEV